MFYGIDVTQGKGLNDGSIEGIRYFQPKNDKSGQFVSCTEKIEIIQQSNYFVCVLKLIASFVLHDFFVNFDKNKR